jgi:hypothetical protein
MCILAFRAGTVAQIGAKLNEDNGDNAPFAASCLGMTGSA